MAASRAKGGGGRKKVAAKGTGSGKKAAASKAARKKAAAKKATSKKAAPKAAAKKTAAKRATPKSAAAKKVSSEKVAPAPSAPEKAAPERPAGAVSSMDVNLGHIFALRPRVTTSFRPDNFRAAKQRLQDESYATIEEAARAVAEEALDLTREAPARGFRR